MQERNSFYLGALLHDIGKFIERAKRDDYRDLANGYLQRGEASRSHGHKRYSAAFVSQFREHSPLFSDRAVETYCLWHHRGYEEGKDDYGPVHTKGILLKLIRIADDCASAERHEDAALEPQLYYLSRLQSIFSEIELQRTDGKCHGASAIYLLCVEHLSASKTSCLPLYEEELVEEFFASFPAIQTEDEHLFL